MLYDYNTQKHASTYNNCYVDINNTGETKLTIYRSLVAYGLCRWLLKLRVVGSHSDIGNIILSFLNSLASRYSQLG